MNQLKKMFFFTMVLASSFAYSFDAAEVNTTISVDTEVDRREQTTTHFIIKEKIASRLECVLQPGGWNLCGYVPVFSIQKLPKSDPTSQAVYSAALTILSSSSKMRVNGVGSCVTTAVTPPCDYTLPQECQQPRSYKSCTFTTVNSFRILP